MASAYPNVEFVKSLLMYDAETGEIRWRNGISNLKKGSVAGTKNKKFGICVKVNKKNIPAHRIAYALQNGEWPQRCVVHVNGDIFDNRASNLRLRSAALSEEDKARGNITHSELIEILNYDNSTGEFSWKKHGHGRRRRCGCVRHDGYVYISVRRVNYLAHVLAWFYVNKVWPDKFVDHIDGNPSNNSIRNLRLATKAQNMQNLGVTSRNKSGYKGVSWKREENKWGAQICANNKRKFLGLYTSPEDAHRAYCEAAHDLHGEFARTS